MTQENYVQTTLESKRENFQEIEVKCTLEKTKIYVKWVVVYF